jgi:exonuclease SbcC
MIKSILLKNFQSHKNTLLELSKGLNIIWGKSDHGKSSIIRGLKWVVTNRPLGDSFRRHNTKSTSVQIEKEKTTVLRTKGGKKNQYKIDKGKPHKALGSKVPEDVSEALCITEANIQAQHETYFMVHLTPGQRSKKLNEVAGLEIMDKTIKVANAEIRSLNADVKAERSARDGFKEGAESLSWVPSADSFLSKLEKYKEELDRLTSKFALVSNIIASLQELTVLKSGFFSSKFTDNLSDLIDQRNKIEKNKRKLSKIKQIIRRYDDLQKQLNGIRVINIGALKKQHISLSSERDRFADIRELIEAVEYKKIEHTHVNKEIKKTDKEINRKLKKLGVCPTCKRSI